VVREPAQIELMKVRITGKIHGVKRGLKMDISGEKGTLT
jgi:hypothetical protein